MPKTNLMKCPYVSKHKVQCRNFVAHIQKCAKTLKPDYLNKFVVCKYNSLHIFTIYEIGAHEMACPNRNPIENLENQLLNDRVLMEQISRSTQQSSVEDSQQVVKQTSQKSDKIPVESCYNKNQVQSSKNNVMKIKLTRDEQSQTICEDRIFQIKAKTSAQHQQIQAKKTFPDSINDPIQNDNEHELEKCKECTAKLCDVSSKLWKNKKLTKYLKAYTKLSQQHKDIQDYIHNMNNILRLTQNKRNSSTQKNKLAENDSSVILVEKNGKNMSVPITIQQNICQNQVNKKKSTASNQKTLKESLLSYVQKTQNKTKTSTQQSDQISTYSSATFNETRNKKTNQILLEESSLYLDTSFYEAPSQTYKQKLEVVETYEVINNQI